MTTFQNRKPRRKREYAFISFVEYFLVLLLIIVFWQDIIAVFTALIDFVFPRQNLTLPRDTINSVITLIAAGVVAAVNLLLFLFVFTRNAGFPVFGFDDLVHEVPLETDEPDPKYPETTSPSPKPTYARSYFVGRVSQILTGTFLQLLWFFRLRGMNAFIRYGSPKSPDIGTAHTLIPGSIASDFDSAYVLDSPQNEGDRQNIPPITGWYGLRFTFRRSLRGSARLDRLHRSEKDVTAFTQDGIEVVADISTTFLLGQRPECVEIAYLNGYQMEGQRIVQSSVVSEPYTGITITTQHDDELDEQDRFFIHQQVRNLINSPDSKKYVPLSDRNQFEFNRDRVFRAITSQSLTQNGDFQEWEQVPLQYTKDIFERILLNYTFEELFGERNRITGDDFPILRINQEIRRRVRNNSLLSFRLLWQKRGLNLPDTEEGGSPYRINRINTAPNRKDNSAEPKRSIDLPVEPLEANLESDGKLLRARGIRLLMAEFENLRPKHTEINNMRLYSWNAGWERETQFIQAESELEYFQIMNEAGRTNQRQFGENLMRIIQSENPEEVVLIQLLSAIQSLVNRSGYEDYLPKDINALLSNIEKWFKES
ncbi:MAG: hypothetical protein K8R40_00905 [Anaerolineaceae bacterium]|nr:hypothetical protein [Anaerolineaceae bacterium]